MKKSYCILFSNIIFSCEHDVFVSECARVCAFKICSTLTIHEEKG